MVGMIVSIAMCLGAEAAPATFTVTIPVEKDRVYVEATYTLENPELRMLEGSYSKSVAGGLSGFVNDLNITQSDGTVTKLGKSVGGRWRIDVSTGETVTVRYDVRLAHEKERWPFGADEIAYTRDDSVFFIARTILVINDGLKDARVRFVVPEGWRVAAPWRPVDGEAYTFNVANRRMLTESCILAGDFVAREVHAGDTVVTLAMGHALDAHVNKMESALVAVVPAFQEVFQDSPQARFLAVVNSNGGGMVTNGSAYPNSLSMLTPARLEGANFIQAIYTIAHEVLHLWNGYRMQSAGQMEWFREGFTDYLTWRMLVKLRLVDERAMLVELQRQIGAYTNLDRTISIAESGVRKADNAVLVYEGGSLAALCLDSLIREHSGGERGIEEFMRAMYARTAMQRVEYNQETIVAAAGEVAGQELRPFFDRYVAGLDPLPLEERLRAMGLAVERKTTGDRASFSVTPDDAATGTAARARDAFLGRNKL